jgi:tRNA(Ile)-lysidine synthase
MPRPSVADQPPGFNGSALPARGRRLIVGVSAGRDSMLLLHLLLRAGWKDLVIAHFNHGLRGRESGQDSRWVRALGRRLGLPVEIGRADVARLARKHGQSLETAAREARHAFFREVAARHRTRQVVLAHHADDQAETILANLCRGAGLNGLSGMRAAQPLGQLTLRRPMLGMDRLEIDRLIRTHGLRYREDASNAATEHRRNRLRHEVLPLLDAIYARRVAPLIVRTGTQTRLAADHLDGLARAALADPACVDNGRRLRLDAVWPTLSPAVQPLVLRHWLREIWQLPEIGHSEIERALTLLEPNGPARINLPGDWQLRRKARRLEPVPLRR